MKLNQEKLFYRVFEDISLGTLREKFVVHSVSMNRRKHCPSQFDNKSITTMTN